MCDWDHRKFCVKANRSHPFRQVLNIETKKAWKDDFFMELMKPYVDSQNFASTTQEGALDMSQIMCYITAKAGKP